MIPGPFDYARPESLSDVLAILRDRAGDAVLLSGGHSLVPLLKLRLAVPSIVVDLGGVDGLDSIEETDSELRIGARATHRAVADDATVRSRYAMLAETARGIGDAQVRDWGTIGGSCAHAHPAADWPAALIAARATIVCEGGEGERHIASRDFFVDIFTTALEPTEVLTGVQVPLAPERSGGAYEKLVRPSGDFAIVGAAAQLRLDDSGRITSAGVGLTGVAEVAFAATDAEDAMLDREPTDDVLAVAADAAAAQSRPIADVGGSEEYKRAMAREMSLRAMRRAAARASEAGRSGEPVG